MLCPLLDNWTLHVPVTTVAGNLFRGTDCSAVLCIHTVATWKQWNKHYPSLIWLISSMHAALKDYRASEKIALQSARVHFISFVSLKIFVNRSASVFLFVVVF